MAWVYVGIGSNIEPERHIRAGLAELGQQRHPLLGLTFAELWAAFDQSRETLTPVALECQEAG